jgi:hypothetical protein
LRARIVPGRAARTPSATDRGASRASTIGWAQRLKRVFGIDIEKCEHCAGPVRIISCIENPQLIEKILKHLGLAGTADAEALPRALPARAGLLD